MNFNRAIQGFILSLGDDYSTATRHGYASTLSQICKYFADCDVGEIKDTDLRAYFASLKERGLTNSTVQYHWKVIRSFYNWASDAINIIRPDKDIKAPKYEHRAIIPFTRDESIQLVKASKTKRIKSIVLILLDTGLRVSELCRMVLCDVSLEQNRLTVCPFETGKKSAARIIPFGRTTKNCIWQYLAQREDTGDNTAPLICTKDYKFMDRNQINKILERLSRASGVENVHAHRFRHTFAIEYLRNGGNIFTLQYQLGHRSLTMVRYYLTLSEADIDAAHRVASPADKWRL